MGTDSGVLAHGCRPQELTWLVRAGLSPQEALRSATSSAAELLELHDVGRIEVGCVADLVVLDGDPWDFARFGENRRLVLQDGVVRRDRPTAREAAF